VPGASVLDHRVEQVRSLGHGDGWLLCCRDGNVVSLRTTENAIRQSGRSQRPPQPITSYLSSSCSYKKWPCNPIIVIAIISSSYLPHHHPITHNILLLQFCVNLDLTLPPRTLRHLSLDPTTTPTGHSEASSGEAPIEHSTQFTPYHTYNCTS
jgi:hypothetical protein